MSVKVNNAFLYAPGAKLSQNIPNIFVSTQVLHVAWSLGVRVIPDY